jgi:hypothetical protein
MVKLLRHDHVTVVFTMSNKRASHQHMKERAKEQLEAYLEFECKTALTEELTYKGRLGSGLKSRSTSTE